MNEKSTDRLYELLPAIYRMRDAERGYPLRALLGVINEQVDLVEDDIRQLYENWFIETCQDWAVPYIGDLIGYQLVHEAGEPGGVRTPQGLARNKILIPRRDVADTIRNRRRKGTLALLEELAMDVAGWPARAVEFFKLLAWTQNINHLHMDRAQTVDLRNRDALDLLDSPFDEISHTVDVRRINSHRTLGRYNIPNVGLFVWRLKAYSVTNTQAYCLEEIAPHCYTFSALGNDIPLFIKPERESEPTHIAEELNLPAPIRRHALENDMTRAREDPAYSSLYYGEGKSFAIWAKDWPDENAPQPIPPESIIVADLADWQYIPPSNHIAVDPVRGRISFPPSQLPRRDTGHDARRLHGVGVSYHYGFSANIGGGEYDRSLQQPVEAEVIQVENTRELNNALAYWKTGDDQFENQPRNAVIEITMSGVYVLPFDITLKADHTLQIRASNRTRPVIRLLDYQAEFPDSLHVTMGSGSRFLLDGLLITGRPVHFRADNETESQINAKYSKPGESPLSVDERTIHMTSTSESGGACLAEIIIRHCTLVPGWGLDNNCEPKRPNEPSLELYNIRAHVRIEHSILGSIEINENQVTAEPIPVEISDSILDATKDEREVFGAPGPRVAHAVLTIKRCTVLGIVETHAIELAENCIFTGCLNVARRQLGCMRFCYVRPGCRTPRRYNCQPDLVEQVAETNERTAAENKNPPPNQEQLKENIKAAKIREQIRVQPQFNNARYGNSKYCQLSDACAEEIKRGADDESEMGAFHDLFNPQREANLRARLNQYTPAGTDAGIIYAS